jgi:CRP-like cAMP-binding protein
MHPAVAAGRVSISQYYGTAVRVLTAGDAFGETALDSSAPRNATVLTVGRCRLTV